jgi:hypothetical protein
MSIRTLWIIFIAVLAATVAAQPFVGWHPHFAVESFFGFNALYGFLACAALILVAKAIGLLVKRPEDYYDE